MLKGTLFLTLIFCITIDDRMFETIYILTGGGPARDTQVLSVWVYNRALRSFDVGYANAGSEVTVSPLSINTIGRRLDDQTRAPCACRRQRRFRTLVL